MARKPQWHTVTHPDTGKTIRYAVARIDGKRVVLIKKG